ncbi:unnamed protein product [Ilex paraguariensis]|uniref:Uncharacterized protein n=1 Tax=Ilex paraguariensis TaxID=185542 RepID=A0ABC8R189_9AQUA
MTNPITLTFLVRGISGSQPTQNRLSSRIETLIQSLMSFCRIDWIPFSSVALEYLGLISWVRALFQAVKTVGIRGFEW